MTIFSIVLLGLIFVFFLKKSRRTITDIFINLTALAATLEIMMSVGYFIRIGGFEIGYSELLIIIDAVLCIFMMHKKSINKTVFNNGILLVLACMISLLLQFIHPYSGDVVSSSAGWDYYYFLGQKPGGINIGFQQIKEIIHVVCYVVVIQQYFMLKEDNKQVLMQKIFNYGKPFIWFGIVEFFLIKILKMQALLTSVEISIFGDSYIGDGAMLSIGVSDRLRGLKSEPSMYGFALFLFFVLAIVLYFRYKKKIYKQYAFVSIILMVCSLSFTAVVCLFGLAVYWLIMKYKEANASNRISILILSFIAVVIVIFLLVYFYHNDFSNYYLKRIHMALINMDDLSITGWHGDYATYDGSTKIRMISILGVMQYFLHRPLFGLALGSTYAHSTMATVLASIGVVGTVAWWRFTFYTEKIKKGRFFFLSTFIWILFLIILGEGLFPFYGVENVLVIYVFELFTKRKGRLMNES